ncbi:MAG: hypothetical protein Q9228_007607, partial [Teloschistes exilis]
VQLHHEILEIPKTYLKEATFLQIFEHFVMKLASEQFSAKTVNFTRACMEIIVVYCLTKKEASTAWLQSLEFAKMNDLIEEFQAVTSFIANHPLPKPPTASSWKNYKRDHGILAVKNLFQKAEQRKIQGRLVHALYGLCDVVPLRAGGPWVAYQAANNGPHGGQGKYDELERQFRPHRLLHEAAELLFHPRTRIVEGVSMVEFLKDTERFDDEQEKMRRIAEDLD